MTVEPFEQPQADVDDDGRLHRAVAVELIEALAWHLLEPDDLTDDELATLFDAVTAGADADSAVEAFLEGDTL